MNSKARQVTWRVFLMSTAEIGRSFLWQSSLYFICEQQKDPAWAESARLQLPLELLKQSLNLEKSITQEVQQPKIMKIIGWHRGIKIPKLIFSVQKSDNRASAL